MTLWPSPTPQLLTLLDDIAKADVGSLNTLVRTDDDTTIEQIDTLPSFDRNADPEYEAMREKAIERFRIAFSRASGPVSARSPC